MVGRASPRPRIGRRIKDMQNTGQQLHSLIRRKSNPINISVGVIASVGADSQGQDESHALPTGGGTMIGPIAFFPKLVTIEDGYIDIGKDTEAYSSRIIVSPEAAASSDNLYTILGAAHAGQLLFLQGVATKTITIRDANESGTAWAISTGYVGGVVVANGGALYVCHTNHTSAAADEPGVGANWEDYWYLANFETLDGGPQTLEDDDVFIFQFDTTDNHWQQLTRGKQSIDSTQIIDGDSKVIVDDSTPDIQTQLDGVTLAAWNKDGSSNERLLFSGAYLDMNGNTIAGVAALDPDGDHISLTDHTIVRPTSGTIAIVVNGTTEPDISDTANVGAIQGPYKESTDSSPSSSTLNDWFGDLNGCFGFQYDSSGADATQQYRLWVKMNSGWHKFEAVA